MQTAAAETAWWDLHTEQREQYGEGAWDDPATRGEVVRLLDLQHGFPLRPPRIVDLGCGSGRLLVPLAQEWPELEWVGVDSSPAMIADASRTAPFEVGLMVGDGRSLPAGLEQIDACYSIALMQHLDPQGVASYMKAISDALAHGGRFVFQFVEGADEPAFLFWQYSVELMLRLCSSFRLKAVAVEPGLLHPEWTWIAAERA